MEFLEEDVVSLVRRINYQEKELQLKKRWLMGLSRSYSELKKCKGSKLPQDGILPESLLREDDIYYETIKRFIEQGFGACNVESGHQMVHNSLQPFNLPHHERKLFSLLDGMTNNGLYHLAEILTGGGTHIEKTRRKMKKIIRECLTKIIGSRNNNHRLHMFKQISQLLNDPRNFSGNYVTPLTPVNQSCRTAAMRILDGLEDLPFRTLSAMHRKLRGIQGYMPQLHTPRSGWGRSYLIEVLRKNCLGMLKELDEEDELPEPLANAMTVASLSLKLLLGCHSVTQFQQFSPEIEALQNEIAKAIWLLKEKVRFPELKNLQLLLDPNSDLSQRGLRSAVRKLLTEYLFECSDMDAIPDCLLKTLAVINRSSRSSPLRFFSKKDIEEEVECVLSVSAQAKQIAWDLLPQHEFDKIIEENYADAYMEDLEESDDGDDNDGNDDNDDKHEVKLLQSSGYYYSDGHLEGSGESNPFKSTLPVFSAEEQVSSLDCIPNKRLKGDSFTRFQASCITGVDLGDSSFLDSSSSCLELNTLDSPQNARNSRLTDAYALASTANGGGSSSPFQPDGGINMNYVEKKEPSIDLGKHSEFVSSKFASMEAKHGKHRRNRNQYLAIQEACDKTSMIAYRLIGRVLDKFAHIEGSDLDMDSRSYLRSNDLVLNSSQVPKEEHISTGEDTCGSIIIQVLEELIPSFPKRGKERVAELMGGRVY